MRDNHREDAVFGRGLLLLPELPGVKNKMNTTAASTKQLAGSGRIIYILVLLLLAEKTVQHVFVTLAFARNWGDIRSQVVVNPDALMYSGAVVAVLFAICFWGLLVKKRWAINLALALALFDIIGEFVAQGTLAIDTTVSFIVAVILLVLTLLLRRQSLG
jgi:hypothetical protein